MRAFFLCYPAEMHRSEENKEPMTVDLWRQDDNGNRFLVGAFPDRAVAEARLAELTQVPHKQTYWITEQPDNPQRQDPGGTT